MTEDNQNNLSIASDSNLEFEKAAMEAVNNKATEYVNKILKYVFVAVFFTFSGAIAATVWDLNGRIYEAVGKTEISSEIYKQRLKDLENKNELYVQEIVLKDCLLNKAVIEKGGCYK